jgi:ribosomal protein S18 acetylase RimI-like enzyme
VSLFHRINRICTDSSYCTRAASARRTLPTLPLGATTLQAMGAGAGVIVVLKDESGAVCGSACMLIEERANGMNPITGALGRGEGLITRVGVLPSHHGNGGGKLLVDELLALARAQRLKRVLLTTTSLQPVAVGLYSTRGFKIVNRNANDDRIPVLDFVEYVMALDL